MNLVRFPNLNGNLSQLQKERNRYEAYVRRIVEVDVGSQQFNLNEFVRCDNAWKVVYLGNNARIELSVEDRAQWRLFVDCSPELPGKSDLRKALGNPIARANVDCSLLYVD